jgi:hypothetical protein
MSRFAWQMVDPEAVPLLCIPVMESAQTLQPWALVWQITSLAPSGPEKWLEAAAGSPERQTNGDG